MDAASEGENKEGAATDTWDIGRPRREQYGQQIRKDNTTFQKPRKGRGRKLEETGLKEKLIDY